MVEPEPMSEKEVNLDSDLDPAAPGPVPEFEPMPAKASNPAPPSMPVGLDALEAESDSKPDAAHLPKPAGHPGRAHGT